MKLAASNLAWPASENRRAFLMLRDAGFKGIEVAPTRLWPGWTGASVTAAYEIASRYRDEGFEIPALQAVLFGVDGLALFGSAVARLALRSHLLRVADLAAAFRAEVVIFGAPAVRRKGPMGYDQAFASGALFLDEVARAYLERGVRLCIEPNPVQYGCDFVTTAMEGLALVKEAQHLGLHLDAAALFLSEDDPIARLVGLLGEVRHFHASEPELSGFAAPQVNHASMAKVLRAGEYGGWVSLEMKEQSDAMFHLQVALDAVSLAYGETR